MTPEELEKLVLKGPKKKLVEALGPLTHAERAKLSKTATSMKRKVERAERWDTDAVHRANLAIMGVGPLIAAIMAT